MKKSIAPILIFAATYAVCLLSLRYTLLDMEGTGLFLLAPDYFKSVFSHFFPFSTLLSDFFTQFFSRTYIAPAIVATIMTAIFLIVRSILLRFGIKSSIPGVVVALAEWFLTVKSHSLVPGVATVLIGNILLIIFSSRKLPVWDEGPVSLWICIGFITACSLIIATNGGIRSYEIRAEIENAACNHEWDDILNIVTPEASEKNRDLLPYALLALNAKGELSLKMSNYPVESADDLEMHGEDYHSLLFASILYEGLNNPAEASLQAMKAGAQLRHHTGFRLLRRLTDLACSDGNTGLANKYCVILRQSSCNEDFVNRHLDIIRNQKENGFRRNSNDDGISRDFALDRLNAYRLLTRQDELK